MSEPSVATRKPLRQRELHGFGLKLDEAQTCKIDERDRARGASAGAARWIGYPFLAL
jgi:hypothetical protein